MTAPNPKRLVPKRPSPEGMAPSGGMEVPKHLSRAEEDFLDLQENITRDPRSTRRLNVYLMTAYLMLVFLIIAGALAWHHWANR